MKMKTNKKETRGKANLLKNNHIIDKPVCKICGEKLDILPLSAKRANVHKACFWREMKVAFSGEKPIDKEGKIL